MTYPHQIVKFANPRVGCHEGRASINTHSRVVAVFDPTGVGVAANFAALSIPVMRGRGATKRRPLITSLVAPRRDGTENRPSRYGAMSGLIAKHLHPSFLTYVLRRGAGRTTEFYPKTSQESIIFSLKNHYCGYLLAAFQAKSKTIFIPSAIALLLIATPIGFLAVKETSKT